MNDDTQGPLQSWDARVRECADCKRAAERDWPPSNLCDDHYREMARARDRQVAEERSATSGAANAAKAWCRARCTSEPGEAQTVEYQNRVLRAELALHEAVAKMEAARGY